MTLTKAPYVGEPVARRAASEVSPTAAIRQHSQWARIAAEYDYSWVFSVGDDAPEDDELDSYISSCASMPANYATMKACTRGGELAILVRLNPASSITPTQRTP